MKRIEMNPEALVGTIEVLWGPNMVAVADRVYGVLDRITTAAHKAGVDAGRAEGQRDANAPSALGPHLNAATVSSCNLDINIACEDHDTKDAIMERLVPTPPEDLYADEMWPNTSCGHSSALCSNFPGCGCIS